MSAPGLKCAGCTACCRSGGVKLLEGDDPNLYITTWRPDGFYIAARDDGNPACRYLGRTGCTIYRKRPRVCRDFDCRLYFLGKTPEALDRRLRESPQAAATLEAGIKRLHTLPDSYRPQT